MHGGAALQLARFRIEFPRLRTFRREAASEGALALRNADLKSMSAAVCSCADTLMRTEVDEFALYESKTRTVRYVRPFVSLGDAASTDDHWLLSVRDESESCPPEGPETTPNSYVRGKSSSVQPLAAAVKMVFISVPVVGWTRRPPDTGGALIIMVMDARDCVRRL